MNLIQKLVEKRKAKAANAMRLREIEMCRLHLCDALVFLPFDRKEARKRLLLALGTANRAKVPTRDIMRAINFTRRAI